MYKLYIHLQTVYTCTNGAWKTPMCGRLSPDTFHTGICVCTCNLENFDVWTCVYRWVSYVGMRI